MADAYKKLYQGQLPSSVGTLVTVGGSVSWIVKHITVVNNDTASRTFSLYRDGTAATNVITPPAMVVLAGGMQEWDGTMAFEASATIRGLASVATMLTVTISGDEIS
jgi:hypothetical protein